MKRSRYLVIILGCVLAIIGLVINQNKVKAASTPPYQTVTVERGTFVNSVAASGNVSSGNNVIISTTATGTVNKVYVKVGDTVTKGQKIADMTLDQDATQKRANLWASYMNAVNSQQTAQQNKSSNDAAMWQAQQNYLTAQNNQNYKNNNLINPSTRQDYTDLEKTSIDSAVIQTQKAFDAAQQKYTESDSAIQAANAQVTSAWLSYQQISPVIIVPTNGVISSITISPGMIISSQSTGASSTTSTTSSIQQVGMISQGMSSNQAIVDLSEVDAANINPGQDTSITLDAYPDKTFAGKVELINTEGVVNSGVTTYPATLTFSSNGLRIYPNMSVTATIITGVEDNVLLVPSGAIQTVNGQSTIRIMRNNQISTAPVVIGNTNGAQTVITSGLNEGDVIVTGTAASTSSSSTRTTSPFSPFGGGGGLRGVGR